MLNMNKLLLQFFLLGSGYAFMFNDFLRFGFRMITSKNGVLWPNVNGMRTKYNQLPNKNQTLIYPKYYLNDFHAYDGGNLNWIAAEECEAATSGVLSFHFKDTDGFKANKIVRGSLVEMVNKNLKIKQALDIVDMASGIGYSVNFIDENLPGNNIIGVEMSPYFIQKSNELFPMFQILNQNAESTSIEPQSKDIVFISYLFHELPLEASINVIRESSRILKKGGILAFMDMKSGSRASNMFSQFIFDRTEPFLNEYKKFTSDRTQILIDNGFQIVDVEEEIPKTTMFVALKTN